MIRFKYRTLDDLRSDIAAGNYGVPLSEDTGILTTPVMFGSRELPNRMAIHPMEGCDGTPDGSPGELTIRRYRRFARGGASLIWLEACAVCHEGRANPLQLHITRDNMGTFAALRAEIAREGRDAHGFEPYTVLQLTHSGRYSRPGGGLPAVIAVPNPYLDPFLPPNVKVATDEELDVLPEVFVRAAKLAREAGFDAVDIKACHRYLFSELMGAYTREGKYGGNFDNRARLIMETVSAVKRAVPDIDIAVRLNAYDELPMPYGFGVQPDDYECPNYTDSALLATELHRRGAVLFNVTGGNPYYNPHVNRPYDSGGYISHQHQLFGVEKLLGGAKAVKSAAPGATVISTGYGWLRHWGANAAAGCIAQGWCDMAGWGRGSFAYPDFAADIIQYGCMNPNKCCVTCSKCTHIMRDGGKTGCVVRDSAVYLPIYRAGREGKPPIDQTRLAEHN